MAPIIVLFTDFGLEGPYTGQVKTVLYRTAPRVPVIDLFADLPAGRPQTAAYLLVDGERALAFGAPHELDLAGWEKQHACRVETVLLTHHHRDTCAAAGSFLDQGVPVRAARSAAEWLNAESVRTYWAKSIPLRDSHRHSSIAPGTISEPSTARSCAPPWKRCRPTRSGGVRTSSRTALAICSSISPETCGNGS